MMSPARRLAKATALIVLVSISGAVHAQAAAPVQPARPDPARGQQIASQVCAACHGPDGNAVITQYPKLTGQAAAYLVKQLNDYAKPADDRTARVNPIMAGFASQLSPQDRRDVSAFYATQPHVAGVATSKDTLELAQRIYRVGVPERGVPSCAGCHGPTGAGLPVLYPRLSGQHAEYTEAQLKAFRDGTRRNSAMMTTIASRLTDAEMKALADYVAGLARQSL